MPLKTSARLVGFNAKLESVADVKSFEDKIKSTLGDQRKKILRKEAIRRAHVVIDTIAENAPSQRISDFIHSLQIEKRFLFGSGYNYDLSATGEARFSLVVNPQYQGDVAWALLVSNYGRGPVIAKGKNILAVPTSHKYLAATRRGEPVTYDESRLRTYKAGKFPRSFEGKYLMIVKRVAAVEGEHWIEDSLKEAEAKLSRGE